MASRTVHPSRGRTSRPLALPTVQTFGGLFRSWKPWPENTYGRNAVRPAGIRVPADELTRGGRTRRAWMEIGPYLSIDPGHDALAVEPRAETIEAILRNTISIAYDTMSFKAIVWDPFSALVTCEHSKIIGGVWLSVIDPVTIPGWAPPQAARLIHDAWKARTKREAAELLLVAEDAFLEAEQEARARVVHRYVIEELRYRPKRTKAARDFARYR